MGIYRCNQCGTLSEYAYMPGMKPVPCVKCLKPVSVFDTVVFVKQLLERYRQQRREFKVLAAQLSALEQKLAQLAGLGLDDFAGDTKAGRRKNAAMKNHHHDGSDYSILQQNFSLPLRTSDSIDYDGIFVMHEGLWFKVMRNKLIY
ncbi:hypothetical protein PT286_07680 [Neisseriaceae bacterium ESL0693]|nr:hypothetical protein [Neisseriaceae bacterium ESL0693]